MFNFNESAPDGASTGQPVAPRFSTGQLLFSSGAFAAMQEHQTSPMELLRRHRAGDWGTVPKEDAQANEQALKYGDRLLSSYLIAPDVVIWVITEADRSSSTFLRPAEF